MDASPPQQRLNDFIMGPTVYHVAPTMAAMTNQWKVSSNYTTPPSDDAPLEVTPGSSVLRRTRPLLPTASTTTVTWPPKIEPAVVVATSAQYPYVTDKDAPHLITYPPGTLTAGLGGIDPKM